MKKRQMLICVASLALLTGCNGVPTSNTPGTSASTQTASEIRIRLSGDGTVMVGKTTEISVRISRDSTDSGFAAEIADPTIATIAISDTSITVTGKKIGETVLTVSSKADPSVKETLDINVIEVSNPTLDLSADKTQVVQGQTLALTATVTDYAGAITYSWKSLYGKGTFSGDKTSSQVTYNANSFGSDTIQVSFVAGEQTYSKRINIFVEADHSSWTPISSKAEFVAQLLKEETVSANFYLTADIDLEGMAVAYHNGNRFAGKLDGQGFSIKNYSVEGNAADKYSTGGLFGGVDAGAIIANTGFEGVVIGERGTGWGTAALACEFIGSLENCKFDVAHTFDGSLLMDENQWFPFCSAMVGVMKDGSTYRNIVVNVDQTNAGGASTIFADVAYPAGGEAGLKSQNEQTFSVENFFTNSSVCYGSVWDWGSSVEDKSGYTVSLDWSTTAVTTYDNLDTHIWKLEQGKMPDLVELASEAH